VNKIFIAIAVIAGLISCSSDENDYQIDDMGDDVAMSNHYEDDDYKAETGISGKISSVGSDTLANLMTFWSEAFKRYYPNVDIQIQAAGSSTAPPALIEGTSNLGPMSRKMKDGEIEAFEKKYGYSPTGIRVAVDALAVYVHHDNPIKGLKISQIDAIFSSTRKCGHKNDISNWGQLGLAGDWANREIQIYGRNSVSGTYGYFKKKALCKGDYKNSVNEQPGSASVVQSVSTSVNGIGYSGIGYKTAGVKALAVSKSDEFIAPTEDQVISGKYPLARFLYVYVNKAPNKELPPLEKEFIKMILSKAGQENVVKDGYVALPEVVIKQELQKLN
jgi:phosphate transport system substrate-binding protein